MDSEENFEMEDNPSSGTQFMELSQSSGILSLPSGNKLAEISIATDISDTETEGDNNFLDIKMPSSSRNNKISQEQSRNFFSVTAKHNKNQREISKDSQCHNSGNESEQLTLKSQHVDVSTKKSLTSIPDSLSLDDVKVTLQENGNLLSDRGFLRELLNSIDAKIAEDTAPVRQNFHQTVPPTRDPGPSLSLNNYPTYEGPLIIPSYVSLNVSDTEQRDSFSPMQMSKESGKFSLSSKPLQSCDEDEYVNLRAGPAIPGGILSHLDKNSTSCEKNWQKNTEKHVKFDKVEVDISEEPSSDYETQSRSKSATREESPEQLYDIQSTRVLRDLTNLRWTLNGWQSVGSDPPTDHKSSLYFLQQLLNMLHNQQLQKKFADEELAKTQTELQRVSKELYVLRGVQERRETRLRAVDSQLELIQKEWFEAHKNLHEELQNNRSQTHRIKEERDALQGEKEAMKKDMARLMETVETYQKSKYSLEETQSQLATSKKQLVDVVEENSRLNQHLQEREKNLKELEFVKLPHLQKELDIAREKASELESGHKQLVREKAHLEDDLRLLHDQYKAVLKKVVEEEEKRENALKEKANLEKDLEDSNAKMVSTKQELHNYYQARVEELVGQKSQSLQDQLNKLEANLKGSLEDQLDAQRKCHHHAITNIQKSHEEDLKKIKAAHMSQLGQLQQQIKALQAENQGLQRQRQGIITAVSSILGSNKENQLLGLGGISGLPDLQWENGQISTSTPIGVGSASPLSEQHPSAKIRMGYPIGHPSEVFASETQGKDHFSHPSSNVHRIGASAGVPITMNGARSALTSRSTSGNSSRVKSSRSSSRPASGKSIRSGISIPDLGLHRSSSSDSDASVFQEGKQTVRQMVGGSLSTLPGIKYPESSEKTRAWHSGSDRGFIPLMDEYSDKNALMHSQVEREYRSLPDLQFKSGHIEHLGENRADDRNVFTSQLSREGQPNNTNIENSAKHERRILSQEVPHSSSKQLFGKKIYKASEILQSSDMTDEEGREPTLPTLNQVDQEMFKLLQELKTVRTDSRTSDSEPPTHDTSFDQDPASITLHKLSQVSTLLSQYVAQSPA